MNKAVISARCASAILAFSVILSLVGCAESDRAQTTVPRGAALLKGAGATFPSELYKKLFEVYQQNHPETVIRYEPVGSGEGIRRFVGGNIKPEERVDFGASDAAMTDEEINRVPGGVVLVPVTAGSVVLAYNLPDVAADLRLSREAYSGIFLGDIKNWNDPRIATANPGLKLPKLTIATVVRQDASGTNFAFTKHLDAISEKWRSRYGAAMLVDWPAEAMRGKGNEGVATLIQNSVGSIGYVGYEFARKLGLRTAILENREGHFIRPTGESAAAALASAELPRNLRLFVPDPVGPQSYPIATFSWVLLYQNYGDPAKAKAIRSTFEWCLDEGQKYSPQFGYVPLPAAVVDKARAALAGVAPPQS